MTRILAVDDDKSTRRILQALLTSDGHEVVLAADGVEALIIHRGQRADLIVLDVRMPLADGFEVLQSLREDGDNVPVLLLTAESAEVDRIQGFTLGADDYVVKPYSHTELRLRVKALLKRSEDRTVKRHRVRSGNFLFDFKKFRIEHQGEPLTLTPREFRLLEALVEKGGLVCSREELLESAWPADAQPSIRSVDVHVARLRTKLDPDDQAQPIGTVSGEGYRWTIPIKPA